MSDTMTTKTKNELQQAIYEHRRNALNLLNTAKKIQEAVRKLPFDRRQAAMNEVIALETEAVIESREVIKLEVEQAANQREEISWQNVAYLNREFFQVENQ